MFYYFGKKCESDGYIYGWIVFFCFFKNEVCMFVKFFVCGFEKVVDYILNRIMEVLKIKLYFKKNN